MPPPSTTAGACPFATCLDIGDAGYDISPRMSRGHRRYLLVEQCVGSAVVNFAINAAIAWALFRGLERVPLWGDQSIMGDTVATSVILPFITALIVTPLARREVRTGRLAPLGWTRA